ncbi:MAG: tocopherol cyclase family protein [Leifsonia flava]
MRTPAAYVRGVRHPEAFHGDGVTRGYFEGWYIKLVSADRTQRWAVIPGVFRGLAGDDGERDEAFVQVLDGLTGRSWYHRFPLSAFRASSGSFDVEVGGNRFGREGVTLDLPQLRGTLRYTTPLEPWPVTVREPGIMGWYGLVPFMECFHGIVSFGHGLAGSLLVEGEPTSFDGGRGYIEKDWGRAFPAGYVWMASNHVDVAEARVTDAASVTGAAWETDAASDASLIASIAVIPWLRGSFRGSIVGFRHSGRLHKWTSYNRSRETALTIDDSHVHWEMQGPDGVLELHAERVRGGLLHAPLRTAMHQRVEETLDARIEFVHRDRGGRVLLEGVAECAGLEVFGDTERLLAL